MKAGWTTSELTFSGLVGAAIFDLAGAPCAGLPEAIVRAAACLGLAWIAARYAAARAESKRGGPS